jgi:hypothetical protein
MSGAKDLQLGWYGYYPVVLADCVDHIYFLHIGRVWAYWINRSKK